MYSSHLYRKDVYMNLSIIKELRKNKGLSQKGLADLINVSSAYIQQIECNKKNPSVSTLQKIASALNVDLSLLLDNTDNRKFVLYNSKDDFPSSIPLDYLNSIFDNIDNNLSIADKINDIYLLENLYLDKIKHLKSEYEDTLDKLSNENRYLRLSLAYLEAKNKNLMSQSNNLILSDEQEIEIDDDDVELSSEQEIEIGDEEAYA